MTEYPSLRQPIPILDARDYLSGNEAALAPLAEALRDALENIGFYYLRGHGVSRSVIASVFEAATRFHAQPLALKLAIKANEHNVGYMPLNGYVSRSSRISHSSKPNLVEALFVKRELAPDHPDVLAHKRFRPLNQWPAALPGFRATVLAYCDAMESLCGRMLPVYATALGVDAGFFVCPGTSCWKHERTEGNNMATQVPRLLYVREAAELTKIQRWRFYDLIRQGKGPRHMRIGKTIRISEHALAEWIDEQHHVTTENDDVSNA